MEANPLVRRTKRTKNFTTIGNDVIQDNRLTIEARGVLIYILSLPEEWVIHKNDLQNRINIGRRTIDRCFEEMKQFGYLCETELVKQDGRFTGKGYLIYDYSTLSTPPLMYTTDVQNEQRLEPISVQDVQRTDVQNEHSTDVQNVQLLNTNNKRTNRESKTSLLTLTIEERKIVFRDSLAPNLEKYGKEVLNKFYAYWTQMGEGDKKMKWEKEKTWDVRYRLSTWIQNERVNKFAPVPYVRPAQNTNAMMSQDNHSNYADYVAWCKKNNVTPEKEEI